ncbi:hypothetical protein EDB84DRAFT_1563476 [Lactarius hengduanensis]|nr:hypothetical protein EDB84DRAFT_1563476 [Lactarius hengduanensis]
MSIWENPLGSPLTHISKLSRRRAAANCAANIAGSNTNPFRTPSSVHTPLPSPPIRFPIATPPHMIATPPHIRRLRHTRRIRPPSVKEKTMSGVPPWPVGLILSLNASNWLEWSRKLISSLSMGQLDVYPCDILKCPRYEEDPSGHTNWLGNDCMVLGFIRDHVYTSEAQCIATCNTSAEAYNTLCRRHEKRSGLAQIQLIQRMMQVQFDNNSGNCDVTMAHLRDLIHHVERIGPVDITRLALLFSLINLRSTHPSVHEALASALMDGTITLEALESRLHYFYELQATKNSDPLAFPVLLPMPMQPPPPTHTPIALPAGILPRATICPNCKKSGHTIDFCISPGGKMAGQLALDAIARQRAARDALRTQQQENVPSTTQSSTLLKIDNDGAVWIGGIKYKPDHYPARAALADVKNAMTAADQGEYTDWAVGNTNPDWGGNADDTLVDTATCLLASVETSLLAHRPADLPLYLDSGASTHISCVCTDFTTLTPIEPRNILGVGNSSVSAIGIGTIEILIPGNQTRLILRDTLYAPEAGVRLMSISRLDESGY